MFSIRIHHGGKFRRYLGRVYVSGHQDIFDMVDIDLFTTVALNMMVVKLDLACEEDVHCLATLVRSFKLIEVIDDVIRQLSFEETELDGEAGFADVAGSGVESSRLSHDESFGVDDLDFNLNEPVNLNGSQIETQSKLFVFEELDVGRSQEPIVVEVSTQEPIVAEVSTQIPIVEEVGTQEFTVEDVVLEDYVSYKEDAEPFNDHEDESAPSDGQLFYDDEGIDI
ncbi:hypothetical protein Tco_1060839 [Tanacetum coccineum]